MKHGSHAGGSDGSPMVSTGGPLAVQADGTTQPLELDPALLAKAFRPVLMLRSAVCLLSAQALLGSEMVDCGHEFGCCAYSVN